MCKCNMIKAHPDCECQAAKPQPHKHAAIIKAWADGAKVQYFCEAREVWCDASTPQWSTKCDYRIKPEPKPDVIQWRHIINGNGYGAYANYPFGDANLKFTFDGETGKLKAVEMI